MLQNYMPPS